MGFNVGDLVVYNSARFIGDGCWGVYKIVESEPNGSTALAVSVDRNTLKDTKLKWRLSHPDRWWTITILDIIAHQLGTSHE